MSVKSNYQLLIDGELIVDFDCVPSKRQPLPDAFNKRVAAAIASALEMAEPSGGDDSHVYVRYSVRSNSFPVMSSFARRPA